MYSNQRASALISALFIMTLVAIAATAMSTRLQSDIHRAMLTQTSDKLYLASQAVTYWAMAQLKKPTWSRTARSYRFPKNAQFITPSIETEGIVYDLQAVLNVNNLQDNAYKPLFERLLPRSKRHLVSRAIQQWISPYHLDAGQDATLTYYLKQRPPYLPGYQPMQSLTELRLVRGMSQALYQQLEPLLTVLPEITPININTAPKAILALLAPDLSDEALEALLQARHGEGIATFESKAMLFQKLHIPREQITLESTYYLSVATTKAHDLSLTTYTLLKRSNPPNGPRQVQILSERIQSL